MFLYTIPIKSTENGTEKYQMGLQFSKFWLVGSLMSPPTQLQKGFTAKEILYCDAKTTMRRYNNVKVSQCVLFDQEKTIGNCFPSR